MAKGWKWGDLSRRQRLVLNWWTDGSEYKGYEGIIADGAIRSGKTVSMAFSFVMWGMSTFQGQNFGMCGKTISSFRRNVLKTLKKQLVTRGYSVKDNKSENMVSVSKGDKSNDFYIFGGRDESSQDLIQGITLAGIFFDEVALMPESFVNQGTGRCSVDGSKFWFNCNPAGPLHWFKTGWIDKCRSRRLVYLHFTMADNLTLTERIRKRYASQYVGVFFQRYIQGLWVAAEGLIYDMFTQADHVQPPDKLPDTAGNYYVSSDFGIQNATVFLLWKKERNGDRWVCLREYYYSGREKSRQKTTAELTQDLTRMLDGIKPTACIVDPSAAALIVELRKAGYSVKQGDNDVLDGISDVGMLLKKNLLLFSASCVHTLNEFGVYVWDEKAAQHGEDRPVKDNDHCMDAVRYFVRTMKLAKREGTKPYISRL